MATQPITIVRIYVREAEHHTAKLLSFLREAKVAGATVMRGTAGFGPDGKTHTTALLELSLDLPEIVEFFDTPERVEAVLARLQEEIPVRHITSWPAVLHGPAT